MGTRQRHAPPPKVQGRIGRQENPYVTVFEETIEIPGVKEELYTWIEKLDQEDKDELTEHFNELEGIYNDIIGDLMFCEEDLVAFRQYAICMVTTEKNALYNAMLEKGIW